MSYWIFQANPKKYRLSDALSEVQSHGMLMTWKTPQHYKEIHAGDTAYIWEAGEQAGIVAVAEVITEPSDIGDEAWEKKYYTKGGDQPLRGVRIRITHRLQSRLPRDTIKDDPALQGLKIFRFANQTNFAVDGDQAAALWRLTSLSSSSAHRDWAANEVTATVADYFAMLEEEIKGKEYDKTAHRSALLKLLSNRSAPAVEFKHCNISAVLRDMGLMYSSGYKPRGNYQDLLHTTVQEYLAKHPTLHKAIIEAESQPPAVQPDASKFRIEDIVVPPPAPDTEPSARRKVALTGIKTDWERVNALSQRLGKNGEEFVLALEKKHLREIGRPDLESRVKWTSEKGDWEGYDIRSFDDHGAEKFIEVKTTNGPEGTAFYLTANELRCSETRGGNYWLYRVFRFSQDDRRLFQLRGPLSSCLKLEPAVYSATCLGASVSP